jgi:hypothetical protein
MVWLAHRDFASPSGRKFALERRQFDWRLALAQWELGASAAEADSQSESDGCGPAAAAFPLPLVSGRHGTVQLGDRASGPDAARASAAGFGSSRMGARARR